MRIVAATTDEEMLHTIIGAQILGGTIRALAKGFWRCVCWCC